MRPLDTARLTDTIRGQLEDYGLTWLRLDAGLGIVRRFDSPAPFRRLKARSLGGCLFLAPSVGNLCLVALLHRFGVRCKAAQRSRPRSAVASASSTRPQCGPASGLVPRMIRREIGAIAGVQRHASTLTRARSTAQEVLPRRMASGSITAPPYLAAVSAKQPILRMFSSNTRCATSSGWSIHIAPCPTNARRNPTYLPSST